MSGCCGCCAALRPRYKRLVDTIFPENPQDGVRKDSMQKLVYYGTTHPEKLDRIGQYLEQRLSSHVSRHRNGYIIIAMEALDQLLMACHAHSNLFVESFLKMVQKLLENHDPELQILSAQSFVKFANIEEDTPSYHRRYDFFVSQFSSMSHSNNINVEVRMKIRIAGLRGIQGVVRKTVSDDLQVNIWEHVHMSKIVPSLLYNMEQHGSDIDAESPKEEENPGIVAEAVFRDLVCRAAFGNIKSVLKPVLQHLDNHELWVPNAFAVRCFKIIMYSVQAQYGYVVVQMLMNHLDDHIKSEAKIKASIVDVVSETVMIAAGGSIGPSVLEVFNTLLRHLRVSVAVNTNEKEKLKDEKRFQEAIINTIGEFANNLPDYQKIEIMMFVMGKVPLPNFEEESSDSRDILLQTMLLKTMLKVATKYKTVLMVNAFPVAFLDPLLRMSLANDAGIRLVVQEILHTLLDRHDNSKNIQGVTIPKDIAQLDLCVETSSRQDIFFMKKNGPQFYSCIYENMQNLNNKVDNFEALYCTLALLCIELGGEEILIELVWLNLAIQHLAVSSTTLPQTHKCAIHAIVAAYFNLIGQLTAIPSLCQHVSQVVECRKKEAPYLLPEFAFNRTNTQESYPTSEKLQAEWLFDDNVISEALGSRGHDTTRISTPFSLFKKIGSGLDQVDLARSANDIHSVAISLDTSAESTPHLPRKNQVQEEITFESLKKILVEEDVARKKSQEAKRKEIVETFRTAPFEEIVAKTEAESQVFQDKLNEILDKISQDDDKGAPHPPSVPVFEMQFPDLYVY